VGPLFSSEHCNYSHRLKGVLSKATN